MGYKKNDYNEILPNLYIGNIDSINYPFDFVVNCTKDIPIKNLYAIRLPVNDTPEEAKKLFDYINQSNVLEKIHNNLQQKRKVLVHCFAGMQRSCAVVACYLVKYFDMTPDTAIHYIQSRRIVAFFGGVNFMNTIQNVYLRH